MKAIEPSLVKDNFIEIISAAPQDDTDDLPF